MIVVSADDQPAQPWKNGGGITRDLVVGGGPAASGWRLSLADIDRDGPFSRYPGVQRWFAVVSGGGVELDFARRGSADGARPCGRPVGCARPLGADDEPLVFDGAAAPYCRLLAGPTRAVNLLLPGGARGTVQRVAPGAPWQAAWHVRGRFDLATLALHWTLGAGWQASDEAGLWIGVTP